jgi:hypothetical protein
MQGTKNSNPKETNLLAGRRLERTSVGAGFGRLFCHIVDVLAKEKQYRERNVERERHDRQRNCSELRRMRGRRRAAPTLLRFRALRTKGLAYDLRECVSCS